MTTVVGSSSTPIEFQIVDIYSTINKGDTSDLDRLADEDEALDPNVNLYCYRNQRALSYKNDTVIKLFGRTSDDRSILVNVSGFQTFFYLGFWEQITSLQAEYIVNTLKRKVNKRFTAHLTHWELIHKQPYEMFVGNDRFPFIKLYFRNNFALKAYEYAAMDTTKIAVSLGGEQIDYYVGESNLDEILKFLHVTDLKPASWAQITNYKVRFSKTSYCSLELDAHISAIHRLEKVTNAPFKIMIYDLECQSMLGELGEFPVAKKNYQKLARELIDLKQTHKSHPLISDPLKFPKTLETCLILAFTPYFYPSKIQQIKTVNNLKPSPSLIKKVANLIITLKENCIKNQQLVRNSNYNFTTCTECQQLLSTILESTFPPMLNEEESQHNTINKHNVIKEHDYLSVSPTLWASLDNLLKAKYANQDNLDNLSNYLEIMIQTAFEDYYDRFGISPIFLKGQVKPTRQELVTMTPEIQSIIQNPNYNYEKRLQELTDYLDRQLTPMHPKGDPIIQIGFTMQRLGQKDPYLKGIFTVDSCSNITNDELIYDENATEFTTKELKQLLNEANEKLNKALDKTPTAITDNILKSQEDLIKYYCEQQKKTDKANVLVRSFRDENSMIKAFAELVNMEDPDMVGGYNTFGFDDPYLADRATELSIREVVLSKLTRLKNDLSLICAPAGADKKEGEKMDKRKMETHYLEMKGRIPFDICRLIRPNHNLPTYRLDFVCRHFFKKVKNDVPPTQIPVLQRGDATDRANIARYCIIDCVLCNRLLDHQVIVPNLIAMSNVSIVPIRYLLFRGQTVKGYSLVIKKCSERGKIVRTLRKEERQPNADKYEGAIVLDPLIDIYDEPISVADFNSLYPSSMISENISNDTLVRDPKYDNLPGFEYNTIQYDEFYYQQAKHKKTGALLKRQDKIKRDEMRVVRFVGNKMGILPEIEKELIASRKFAKKKMAEYADVDPALEAAWNCQQLAYKVTCNSIYGITGAGVSPIYNKDVAASITATGRKMIIFSKNYVEQNYVDLPITLKRSNISTKNILVKKASCVYGDSVVGDTPILVRFGKSYQTAKYIKIGELIPRNELYLTCDDGKEVVPLIDIEVWSDKGWSQIHNVIRHKTHKMIYRVTTKNSLVEVTEDHSLLDNQGHRLTPNKVDNHKTALLQHEHPNISANPIPLIIDDKHLNQSTTYLCISSTKDQLEAALCWQQITSAGYYSKVEYHSDLYFVYACRKDIKRHNTNDLNICQQVTPIGMTDDYVYDLETEHGHFSAGIGNLVVHNTDSIFIKFDMYDQESGKKLQGFDAVFASMEICDRVSTEISLQLKDPQNLEFEKTIYPFLLINKKMYKGHYYTKMNIREYYENTMGFATKKRDSAPIAKIVVDGLTHLLFSTPKDQITQASIRKYLVEQFETILSGKLPLDVFIRTKSWKGHYANPDQIAQHVLATRQAIRDPGNQFSMGDRIPFVHIVNPKATLQGEKIETVDYVTQHNLKIDYQYYIEKQLINPLLKILSPNRNLGITEKWLLNILKNLTQAQQHVSTMDQFFKIIPKDKETTTHNEDSSASESD